LYGECAGAVIFLDQEEGGRMLPELRAFVYAWIDAVNASGIAREFTAPEFQQARGRNDNYYCERYTG
jgi:hypothetical protein